jgi:Rieske Fe-S protein
VALNQHTSWSLHHKSWQHCTLFFYHVIWIKSLVTFEHRVISLATQLAWRKFIHRLVGEVTMAMTATVAPSSWVVAPTSFGKHASTTVSIIYRGEGLRLTFFLEIQMILKSKKLRVQFAKGIWFDPSCDGRNKRIVFYVKTCQDIGSQFFIIKFLSY